jgi:hypothetical protein
MDENNDKIDEYLGQSLEPAPDFIRGELKKMSTEKSTELADPDSVTANELLERYLQHFPYSMVNERDVYIHRSNFKRLAKKLVEEHT